jgi:diacylglycerol kinase (ATP)
MKTLLIVNPASADGATGRRWPTLRDMAQRALGPTFEAVLTDAPGHATQIARAAHNVDTVVCVGGDGTLNEVVDGLMRLDAGLRPRLGMVPAGTGSDFARGLPLPRQPQAALAVIAAGHSRRINIGEAAFMHNRMLITRHFVNIAGVGFDAEAVFAVSQGGKGRLSYLLSVLRTLVRFRNKQVRLTLHHTGQIKSHTLEGSMIAVCNGLYFGGGMRVAPNADPADGVFDVVALSAMSRLEFLMNFPRVYRGAHLTHPKVRVYRASEVRIEPVAPTGEPVWLEAEGELLGEVPASFRLLPRALEVLM